MIKHCNQPRLAKSSRARHRRAAALVEFAVVLPVILIFITATIEISRVLMLQHTVDTAAYEAARSTMVPGAASIEAEQEAQILLDAAGLTNTVVTVTPAVITEETAFITVRVEVPVDQNSWITPDRFANFNVVSEVTLLTERSPIVRLTGVPELKAKKTKMKKVKNGL